MKKYKTEQEAFWAGEFGNKYISRNEGLKIIAANAALFSKILGSTVGVKSVIEFGANIGLNLLAIRTLLPNAELSAIEINKRAASEIRKIGKIKVYTQSILDFVPKRQYDFVFTKGVLIHMNPESLAQIYDLINETAGRYICIAEYYNPKPVSIAYRGHKDKLFKRDFAGEMLDKFGDLRLIDYGFVYHRDNNFSQDDINWFLLEKQKYRKN